MEIEGVGMNNDFDEFYKPIRECLTTALADKDRHSQELSDFLNEHGASLQILMDTPTLMPLHILFALAHDLGVTIEICEIVNSYEWFLTKQRVRTAEKLP
jgi:hypothetical protein